MTRLAAFSFRNSHLRISPPTHQKFGFDDLDLVGSKGVTFVQETSPKRPPHYVRDLVARVIETLSLRRYSTYHVVNSGVCSYYDFALDLASLLEISDTARLIEPVKLDQLRLLAERPRDTPMRCTVSDEIGLTPLRDWRVALTEFIREDCR